MQFRGAMSQLIHDAAHVHLQPMLLDAPVANTINNHQVSGHSFMSRLDTCESTLVDSAECASHRYQVLLRDELLRNELIRWKGRLYPTNMLYKGGITHKSGNKFVRLWLTADCMKIIFNELSALCR